MRGVSGTGVSRYYRTMRLAWGLVVLTSCASSVDYVTGDPTLNRYSLADDVDIGTRQATLLLAGSEALGQPTDPEDIYTRTVWSIAARLLAVPENRARMPPLPWEVHLVGTEAQNAWCFPGGTVLVLAGLMRTGIVRDEDELAAILGHEMAHSAARHWTEKQTIESLRRYLGPLGRFFGPRLVELANPGSPDEVLDGLNASREVYDQSQEIEADLVGLEMMARAGYDASKASTIWARLAASPDTLSASGVGKTHPAYKKRLQQLARHEPVAAYVVRRRASAEPTWIAKTGWTWTSSQASEAQVNEAAVVRGPLPQGPKVRSFYMRPRAEVMSVSLRLFAGPNGEAPRAAVRLEASRDLYEDGLPLSAELTIDRFDDSVQVFRAPLAVQSALQHGTTTMRVALPRLAPGKYRVGVRAVVGALRVRAGRLIDVTDAARSAVADTR